MWECQPLCTCLGMTYGLKLLLNREGPDCMQEGYGSLGEWEEQGYISKTSKCLLGNRESNVQEHATLL